MADISNLKVGSNTYSIKDTTSRTTANNADIKADQALIDSASAEQKAATAKYEIEGASITGTYTSGTETLEISLTLGTVPSNNS